jgi:hypothetical protein
MEEFEIPVNELQLHPEAMSTPLMLPEQYQAFKLSIETDGQQDPGVVFRGRLVDGRHRLKALIELGIPTMKVVKMPNNSTIEEIRARVCAKENRRQQTPSQLAIYGYNKYKQGIHATIADAAKYSGVSTKQIARAKRIDTYHRRPDILDAIFNAGKIDIGTGNRVLLTDSLATLDNWLAENTAKIVGNTIGLSVREELSESEELMIGQILHLVSRESTLLLEQLAARLYSKAKEDVEI